MTTSGLILGARTGLRAKMQPKVTKMPWMLKIEAGNVSISDDDIVIKSMFGSFFFLTACDSIT